MKQTAGELLRREDLEELRHSGAAREIFEPRRFGRRDRGARGPDGNNGVRRRGTEKGA